MCNLIVNNVGDANFIFLQNINSPIILDCGIQNSKNNNEDDIKRQLEFANELIISHYHTDHYNFLYKICDKSLHIKKLYYPYIPKFESQTKLVKEICFINFLKL